MFGFMKLCSLIITELKNLSAASRAASAGVMAAGGGAMAAVGGVPGGPGGPGMGPMGPTSSGGQIRAAMPTGPYGRP